MSRMPGAQWRPLAPNWASQPRMRKYDILCFHTMVGSLWGTDAYFRTGNGVGYNGTESHFGTGGDGTLVQWQDTDFQADANYNGNPDVLSVENADMGPEFKPWNINDASQVPAFTAAQIERGAQIAVWAHREHGIPLVLIPDTLPGRRGIAYHRQGVPGYVVPGGVVWSTAYKKACPADRRIAQMPLIVARAQQIINGTQEEDDMYDEAARAELLVPLQEVLANARTTNAAVGRLETAVSDPDAGLLTRVARIEQILGDIADEVDGEPTDPPQ